MRSYLITVCLNREGLYARYDQEITKLLDAKYAELVPVESLQNAT